MAKPKDKREPAAPQPARSSDGQTWDEMSREDLVREFNDKRDMLIRIGTLLWGEREGSWAFAELEPAIARLVSAYLPSEHAQDVGASYSLLIERHVSKPLWRLCEVVVDMKGTETRKATDWLPFAQWTPDLLLARGRLQQFVFSGDPRMPREIGRQRGAGSE